MESKNAVVYAGIDVAKATLQLHLQSRQSEFANSKAGLGQLLKQLQKMPQVHVICEATGGYEQAMVRTLHAANVPVSVINPAQVRAAGPRPAGKKRSD